MTVISIAMLDRDHHIHLIPADRVQMLSIEHTLPKKTETEHFEVECIIRLAAEGIPHPLEDSIRFSFASAKVPGQQMMIELTFVQNHIIKTIFDSGLSGSLVSIPADDHNEKEVGVTISSLIRQRMQASVPLRDVLARHGAFPDTLAFSR
ncbi:MAG: hypothetical protein WC391_02725 [Methanoregula sp.]|jgi:hypothetical protein